MCRCAAKNGPSRSLSLSGAPMRWRLCPVVRFGRRTARCFRFGRLCALLCAPVARAKKPRPSKESDLESEQRQATSCEHDTPPVCVSSFLPVRARCSSRVTHCVGTKSILHFVSSRLVARRSLPPSCDWPHWERGGGATATSDEHAPANRSERVKRHRRRRRGDDYLRRSQRPQWNRSEMTNWTIDCD